MKNKIHKMDGSKKIGIAIKTKSDAKNTYNNVAGKNIHSIKKDK